MSQSQTQKQKEAIGRRQFNISPSEQLIDHLSCKYKSKLSAGGALWIFKWHFCYYSNIFGAETKIRIRTSEIAQISSSGNSSIGIITTKNNESHKFVGFPSKERRDAVVRFLTKQHNQHKKHMAASFSPATPSINKSPKHTHSHSLSDANISSNYLTHSMSMSSNSHSHKSISHSPTKPVSTSVDDSFAYKTATIHPKTTPPPQAAIANNNIHIKAATVRSNGVNIVSIGDGHHDDNNNTSDMATHSQQREHITPAKFISNHGKKPKTLNGTRKRRELSESLNFRLQSIHSQHSLNMFPAQEQADSDSEDEQMKKLKSGMDTLDIFNFERSLSIHSDDTHQNRMRSWSDSDMPHHGDTHTTTSPKNHQNDDVIINKTKSAFAGGWLRIFQSKAKHQSHTKQNKKKKAQHAASAPLTVVPKSPPPKVPRTRCLQTEQNNIPKSREITHSQSVPEESKENKEGPNNSNTTNTAPKPLPLSLAQYINESYASTPIHLGSLQNLEWKPLYSDDFWSKPALLFHEAFSDAFVKKMHATRKSTGLKIGEWNIDDDEKCTDNQPITYVRKSEYISKIKDPPPFMPAKTEVYETQRFRFYGRDRVVVDAAISTPNIKYGDYFIISQRYVFTVNERDENKTHMDCSLAIKWVKKTWFEKIITSKATSEAEQGVAMWASKLHEIFLPKISKQEMLIKQISKKDLLPSPRRRVIDKKVIDYFHAPMIQRSRRDVIVDDWLRPCGELLVDVLKVVCRKSSWTNLYNVFLQINDVEQDDNLITVKHGVMAIVLVVLLFVVCNMGWMLMWYWNSSSLSAVIRQQNDILQQQSQVFEQLLLFLKQDKCVK